MEEVTASCSCFNLLTNTCLNYALYYVTFFLLLYLLLLLWVTAICLSWLSVTR